MVPGGNAGNLCTVAEYAETCYNSPEIQQRKDTSMAKTFLILRRITAAATLLVTALLCIGFVSIYLAGQSSENLVNGVYLSPVFTRENVGEMLLRLAPVFVIYGLLVVAAFVVQAMSGSKSDTDPTPRPVRYTDGPRQGAARFILAALALLFIILGVMNGGARDVLIKAINICTECIGLG